eukprot:CAMPEP_0176162964 /NCGR_PEP_ID=MMETSP0120_2-20121206/83372_1 /TAXON_ID=160619 /ORGANISM="Kryptoperidinium foliaceum, Strain CCMP 1326" /LENGTH=372 /DNA_ID=CAMNT_0017500477 /DNA_START=87 /DNA_END=1205 /DNA_ORIENTATION=+
MQKRQDYTSGVAAELPELRSQQTTDAIDAAPARPRSLTPAFMPLLVDVRKYELGALVVVDVHLLRYHSVALVVQGEEEAVDRGEAPAGAGAPRSASTPECGARTRAAPEGLAAQDLRLEQAPLEPLDIEFQHVHLVMTEQAHRLGERPETKAVRALTSEVVVALVECRAALADAPIVEREGLAGDNGARRVHCAIEGVRFATFLGHLLLEVGLPSDAHAVDDATAPRLSEELQPDDVLVALPVTKAGSCLMIGGAKGKEMRTASKLAPTFQGSSGAAPLLLPPANLSRSWFAMSSKARETVTGTTGRRSAEWRRRWGCDEADEGDGPESGERDTHEPRGPGGRGEDERRVRLVGHRPCCALSMWPLVVPRAG